MTRIAVIGVGNIGGTLGDACRSGGHDVTFGVRHPGDRDTDGRAFATPEVAVRDAEAVVFAVPGAAMDETVPALARDLRGKVVIDATNRFGTPIAHSQALEDAARSEEIAVFRAFNSPAWENFRDPHYGDNVADLFYAGPDGEARALVESLIADVGLRPIHVGTEFEVVDGVPRLWFALAMNQKMGRDVAFKVLTR